MSLRQIVEQRSGAVIVSTIAAIAAGGAISGSYAAGVFDSPPPACYLSLPNSGATLVGSSTFTAACGASTVQTLFQVDGQTVDVVNAAPFTYSWPSASVADGSHAINAFACDANGLCVQSGSVSVTTANAPHGPVNTVLPAITGNLVVGQTDTCSQGTWTGDTTGGFTYQWKDGSGNVAGATSATYVVGAGESGLFLHCTVTATGASGTASADSNAVGPITANGGLTAANVWVSANGSDVGANCSRSVSAISMPTATTVCKTLTKAYQLASPGDIVLISNAGGSFPQQTIAYTAAKANSYHCDWNTGNAAASALSFTADYSGCITFTAASGQAVTLTGLFLEVNYVRLDGTLGGGSITFDRTDPVAPTLTGPCTNQTLGCVYGQAQIQLGGSLSSGSYNCYGDTTASRPQQQDHDDVIQNVTSNDTFYLDGASHVALLNSTFTAGDNFRPNNATSQMGGCISNDNVWEPNQYILFQGNTIKDGSEQHAAFSSAQNWTLLHSEAIHFNSGQHDLINANKFLNLNGHALFAESQQPPAIVDVTLENNLVDTPCSQQATGCSTQGPPWFGFTAHATGDNVTLALIRFNTYLSGSTSAIWNKDSATIVSGTMYGNALVGGTQACATLTSLNVTAYANISTSGTACGTGSQVVGSLGLTSSIEDGTPLAGSSAIDFVPTSVTGGYPPLGILGLARPDNAESFLDAGAYETQGVG